MSTAFENYDMEALTSLIQEDATQSMPPFDLWLRGRDDILTWWFGPGIGCRGSRLVPTVAANGSPAYGQYKPTADGGYEPWALQVIELRGRPDRRIHASSSTRRGSSRFSASRFSSTRRTSPRPIRRDQARQARPRHCAAAARSPAAAHRAGGARGRRSSRRRELRFRLRRRRSCSVEARPCSTWTAPGPTNSSARRR